jgi:hypothetical protein
MENDRNKDNFLKIDNDTVINTNFIRWMQQVEGCIEVCTIMTGCNGRSKSPHTVCKKSAPEAFEKLSSYFK